MLTYYNTQTGIPDTCAAWQLILMPLQVVGTLEDLFKFMAASSDTLDIPIDKDSKPDEVSLQGRLNAKRSCCDWQHKEAVCQHVSTGQDSERRHMLHHADVPKEIGSNTVVTHRSNTGWNGAAAMQDAAEGAATHNKALHTVMTCMRNVRKTANRTDNCFESLKYMVQPATIHCLSCCCSCSDSGNLLWRVCASGPVSQSLTILPGYEPRA